VNDSGIPTTADEIDAAWLTEALAERHPGAKVASVEVTERHEVTNSHAKLRVEYDEPAGAPPTMFCKLAPLDPTRRDSILRTGMGLREAQFYASLAPTISMRVPVAHVARFDESDGTFVLLLEDLDASGCTVSSGPEGVPVDSAARALEELADMHLRYRDPATRKREVPWAPEWRPSSTYGAVMLRYGLDNHRDRLTDQFAAIAEIYIERPDDLQMLWHEGPKTLLHGDTHIGNVFFDHGRTGFLDWGIMNVNTPMRDLSYFLTMALTPDDRRASEADLIRLYLDRWKHGGGDAITFDEAWTAHRVHAAYTVPASCQVVMFPEGVSERRRIFADAFLDRAQQSLDDLDALGALRARGF
jgi:aminoglycoside phosphotransferase (APT) family kinase protein